jgi:hypothetical protein
MACVRQHKLMLAIFGVDVIGHSVNERPEQVAFFRDCALCLLAFADIADDAHQIGDACFGMVDRRDADFHIDECTVGAFCPQFHLALFVQVDDGMDRHLGISGIVGVNERRQGEAQIVPFANAKQTLKCMISLLDAVFEINQQNTVAAVVENRLNTVLDAL